MILASNCQTPYKKLTRIVKALIIRKDVFPSKQLRTELILTEVIASIANYSAYVWDTFVTQVSSQFVGVAYFSF